MRVQKEVIIIIISVLFISLPFCGRAFFIDDYYHFNMAKEIVKNPLKPYGFKSKTNAGNSPYWKKGVLPDMVNPPLMHYCLAVIIKLFGDEVYKIRIGFLIFPILSGVAIYFIGKRFCRYPLLGALAAIATPVFRLNSYSLLIDMCMITFFLWGFEILSRGLDRKNPWLIFWGGILLGLAPLAKYPAYPLVIFIILWLIFAYKSNSSYSRLLLLVVPCIPTIIWSIWNVAIYDEMHFLAAARRIGPGAPLEKIIHGLSFLTGSTIILLGNFIILYKREKYLFYSSLTVIVALFLLFYSWKGGFDYGQSLLLSVFIISSGVFIFLIIKNVRFLNPFLIAWFLGGLIFLLLPIPWLAARYFLIILAPMILLMLGLFQLYFTDPAAIQKHFIASIICTLIISTLIACSDYLQANVNKEISLDMNKKLPANFIGKKYYLGGSGFGHSYYLAENGWLELCDYSVLQKGDLILFPVNILPLIRPQKIAISLTLLSSKEYSIPIPLTVMNFYSSAGFYGSVCGPLPFSFSTKPVETVLLYRVD